MIDDLNNLSNCNKDKIRDDNFNDSFNKIKKSFIHDTQATKVQKNRRGGSGGSV